MEPTPVPFVEGRDDTCEADLNAPALLAALALTVAAPAALAGEPSPYMSQTVEVGASHWFQHVTFKDVGLSTGATERDGWMRTVTRVLAATLDTRLHARASVEPRVADPAWHRSCQGHHVYVDVWRSTAPDRVGFSLWRGCGEGDRFAWQEVPMSGGWDASAPVVARAIAHALQVCDAVTC
jgi:hypothetical protein